MKRYRDYVAWGLLLLGIGVVYIFFIHDKPEPSPGPPGWEDLILCSDLTSIDSKKTLSLHKNFSARLKDGSGIGDPVWSEGRWALLNAEQHAYSIEIPGAAGHYIVVSPPDSDGCVLAAGTLNQVDLGKSWFSMPIELPQDDHDLAP